MPMIAPDPAVIDRAIKAGQLPEALRAGLADPPARIALTLVTRDGVRRLDCYTVAGTAPKLAAVTSSGNGKAAATFPLENAAIEALLNETLGLDAPLAELGIDKDLDGAALWALAAMADAHRQRELESLLASTPARHVAVDEDAIYLRVLDGAALPDPRWLSGLLTQLLGPGDVSEARLQTGLVGLARAGLVAEDEDGLWAARPEFATAFAQLEVPLAGAMLSIDRRTGNGIDHGTLALLRTLSAGWTVEPHGTGEASGVRLRSMGRDAIRSITHAALTRALQAELTSAKTVNTGETRSFCPQCGRPTAATDRFCGQCGVKLG